MINFFTTIGGVFTRLVEVTIAGAPLVNFVFWLTIRDLYYSIGNLFLRSRPVGKVVSQGCPGYRGQWPEYSPPNPGRDSRSPCPGLNALANHGILPHDGRRINYIQLSHAIQHAYNLSPSLGDQLTASALQLDQGRGWIDLQDLNAMNKLVDKYLAHTSDGKHLSLEDITYYSGLRRAECRSTNGQYSLKWSFLHEFFGSGNGALMYSIFGGNVNDMRCWLTEERLPEGWEPKNREALGHTILQAQITSLAIEFNINEKQKLRPGD
ncbi:hypothetical protein DH86_00001194, partial [Scytalidium sp. 3C]